VVQAGTTLLEAGRDAGLLLSANCGGVGLCGRCRVTVVSGDLFAPSENEQASLGSTEHGPAVRLACEARVASSVVVEVPAGSLGNGQRLQVDGTDVELSLDPIIESHQIVLVAPKLGDSRSDYRRVVDALKGTTGVGDWIMHPRVGAQLRRMKCAGSWELTSYSRGNELIGFASAHRPAVGLAVDVGCTKIAAYLLDPQTGKQFASGGVANPQISYGEDLITRLVFASRNPAQAELMAKLVRDAIHQLAANLCSQANIAPHEIADICIVGNTAMMHLLLEMPVQQLLHAPFVSSIDRDIDVGAWELELESAPGANVHVLPSIGGFVGADHVAMILAHGIDGSDKITIGIDIGTNTEIAVHDPRTDTLLTTSVPSGPAFEGGHVGDGMRAGSGAIEKVFFANRKLEFRTIDGVAPVGICGSGMVDLLAELRQRNYLDERGHLVRRSELVREGKNGLEVLVVPAAEAGHGRDIALTQHDITEVQLAKAAVYAGIATLLGIAGIDSSEVQEMAVAGAFGSYLDLRSAVTIGLLPRLPNARYLQIGNAAGTGAKMALISCAARERARRIAKRATRIELKQHEGFNRVLARATRFPPRESPVSKPSLAKS
jgi:uncharacterized 2Fe-2S/4Fe-4S cluster protein (DUF4445 family)